VSSQKKKKKKEKKEKSPEFIFIVGERITPLS
jgi:hypothetical protein